MTHRRVILFLIPFLLIGVAPSGARAQTSKKLPPGLVWYGTSPSMTFQDLASYCAPFIWFSGDEPLLSFGEEPLIQIPMALPFDRPAGGAVLYYRVTELIGRLPQAGEHFYETASDKAACELHLDRITDIKLHYFFYYPEETGVGAHPHDYETLEMNLRVLRDGPTFGIQVTLVVAHAHGVVWYFNTLDVEAEEGDVRFPITILVEEGKHGNCTDRNGDGFYSPGYDVNRRVNDAWGCRDILRSGQVFTSEYQGWMTKVRFPRTRIAPPLPEDSPLYEEFSTHDFWGERNMSLQYELRPVPDYRGVDFSAITDGDKLEGFIVDKGYPVWPEEVDNDDLKEIARELYSEEFLGSISVGYRYDGFNNISVVFPLLITRNVEAPTVGGWWVHRIFTDFGSEFGYTPMYTPSASRWHDWYVAFGPVWQHAHGIDGWRFMWETGSKFRGNISHTSLSFLSKLGTDFWGFRIGLRGYGFEDLDELGLIFEIGAGVW